MHDWLLLWKFFGAGSPINFTGLGVAIIPTCKTRDGSKYEYECNQLLGTIIARVAHSASRITYRHLYQKTRVKVNVDTHKCNFSVRMHLHIMSRVHEDAPQFTVST